MAFGDGITGLFDNIGQGSGGWYLGANLGMQPGQAANLLQAGGPGATALALLLKRKGATERDIEDAVRERRPPPTRRAPPSQRMAAPKTDYTPILIGLGILGIVVALVRK